MYPALQCAAPENEFLVFLNAVLCSFGSRDVCVCFFFIAAERWMGNDDDAAGIRIALCLCEMFAGEREKDL